MKKILLLLFCLFAISLSACTGDSDAPVFFEITSVQTTQNEVTTENSTTTENNTTTENSTTTETNSSEPVTEKVTTDIPGSQDEYTKNY